MKKKYLEPEPVKKRTGSATLVLKHILVKFSLGRDSKLSMFNILGRLLVYNNTGTGTVQLHITGYFCRYCNYQIISS